MSQSAFKASSISKYPSVDDNRPDEQGGPIAREGYDWQDEVAVAFLIEMLETPSILKIHCETHDDILIVHQDSNTSELFAEYVQVKAVNQERFWSVANLCAREKSQVGSSILETSFKHDKHRETSRFRVVTTLPVVNDLLPLTHPRGNRARSMTSHGVTSLSLQLKTKFPTLKSEKGHDVDYWIDNCFWDVRHSDKAVRDHNFRQLFQFGQRNGKILLPDFVERILDEMRLKVKDAGRAKWEPNREKKILSRSDLLSWWEQKSQEIVDGALASGGGKLREKMTQAGLPNDLIALALEQRREYAATMRAPRYLELDKMEELQSRAKSKLLTLRAQAVADAIAPDAVRFHSMCLNSMEEISSSYPADNKDYSAFLQGCLYDIADRCLLRFERQLS